MAGAKRFTESNLIEKILEDYSEQELRDEKKKLKENRELLVLEQRANTARMQEIDREIRTRRNNLDLDNLKIPKKGNAWPGRRPTGSRRLEE